MEPYQVRPLQFSVDPPVIYPILPRSQELKPHYQMQFNVIFRVPFWNGSYFSPRETANSKMH